MISCNNEEEKTNLIYCVIQPNDYNPMYHAFLNGCIKAAQENSLSKNYNIIIDNKVPESQDNSSYENLTIEAINSAKMNLFAGLMLNPINSTKLKILIEQGALAGIKIFTLESDVLNSLRYSYFGPDNYNYGKQLGIEAITAINAGGVVAILAGTKNNNAQQQRISGILDKINEEWFVYVTLATNGIIYTDGSPQDSKEKFLKFDSENHVDVWVILNSSIFFADDIFPFKPGKVKIIACDGFPKQLEYMDKDYICSIVVCDYFTMGENMLNSMINLTQYEIEPEVNNYINLRTIHKGNIEEWLGNWNNWLK